MDDSSIFYDIVSTLNKWPKAMGVEQGIEDTLNTNAIKNYKNFTRRKVYYATYLRRGIWYNNSAMEHSAMI